MKSKKKILLTILSILIISLCLFTAQSQAAEDDSSEYIYLSDMEYIASKTSTAWGTIQMDQASGGGKLTVKVQGTNYTFDKGIWAHATSTLVYDISEINTEYDYFTTYMGLNSSAASSSNGVKFTIYTSEDGTNWTAVTEDPAPVSGPGENARYVEIPIDESINYLKLYADSNGSNGNDHSVYADAKFVKKSYLDRLNSLVPDISTIDEKIKTMVDNGQTETEEYELTLLQRTLVNNAGTYALTRFITESEENKTTYSWLFNDLETLRLYLVGGKPEGGSYLNSLTVLTKLYTAHKEDLSNTDVTQYGTTLGDLYRTMMLAISLTHSSQVYLWCDYSESSDPIVRYEIYKALHEANKIECKVFESLTVEEMRWVMNTIISDEEIEWLNDYVRKKGNDNPYGYITYTFGYNYSLAKYYSEEQYDAWDEKYSLSQYNITYQTGHTRLWIVFEEGSVCGGISKTGSCIWGAYRGLPNTCVSQPGHCAYLRYYQNANGDGYWQIWNNVTNWATSGRTEHLSNRMPNDWQPSSGWAASYITLAQSAQNEYDKYEKAEIINMLADVYSSDSQKLQSIYREALEEESINYDSWVGLINAYAMDESKTEEDWYDLAEEMTDALIYYPLPMYNLLNMISPHLTSGAYISAFNLLENRALTQASKTTSAQFINADATTQVANYLLGNIDNTIATFSFDGDRAEEIVLSSRFDNMGVTWDYSLDGGNTWTQVTENSIKLTDEEIKSITSENDILVHLIGVNYEEKNIYTIDILESEGLPSTLYANDWENKLIGATDIIKWRMADSTEWHLYGEEQPDLTGDKEIVLKVAATGTRLESQTETTYTFTTNTDPDTRKYISIDHISLYAFSTEADGQGRYARYAIDANLNTSWHSNWNGNDTQKFITFEFDEVKNLTAVEYFPNAGGNGKILSAQILVSLDGETWTEVVSGTNWTYANTNDITTKSVDFDAVKAKYVKIVGKETQNSFIAARMFNLYEDTTAKIVGTFVFDGDNANKIIIDSDFLGQSWEYSIDNGTTWYRGSGDVYELPASHVNNITAENKIKMRFDGSETVYTININEMETPTISAYLNDWENRLIGVASSDKENLEWQIEGTDTWTDYTAEDPVVAGEKKLYIRRKASLNYAPSQPQEFQFTADSEDPTQKYIPIAHLSVQDYTSESVDSSRPYYAPNAIDGNANTLWHTTFAKSLIQEGIRAHYTVKLDEPKAISAVEFMQWKYRDADPAFIKSMYVYISDDNVEWVELGRLTDISQTEREFRRIEFEESMTGQYVKFEMETYDMFASLAMINLYEDTTNIRAGTFSFDGDNANKIVLEESFVTSNWEYSLDGGETWNSASGAEHLLTTDEVHEIDSDNRIKLRINNVVYTINIQKSEIPDISAYLNDLENRLIGLTVSNVTTDGLEWRIVRETKLRAAEGWTDYSEEEPVVEGDAILQIRAKARGIFAPSDIVEFEFTDDNQPDTRKYIPVAQLSIASVSAEDAAQSGLAVNAIDANYNTRWLNSSAGTDQIKNITIKFDSATYVTAMDYVPHSENGKILAGTIEGSMDGENFTLIANITGWANNQDTKTIDFDEPVKVRYIRITGTSTSYTSTKRHIGARMFNFYEDTTIEEKITPTADVEYSIEELTNQDVVATLVNESTDITILNNDGSKSYTFTENGEFTFEFEDSDGNKGSTTAKVDWIAKTLPNPTLTYDYPDPTNTDVTVTVTFDVPGTTITNNNGSNTYTFTKNGEFTFEFVGPFGNAGTVTATVDWIIRTLPNAEFKYSTTERTNKPVTVTVSFDIDGTTITNNNGSDTYTFTENGEFTFEFEGPYGNAGVATASVDWIDTTTPTAEVVYNITSKTNQDVVATLDMGDKDLIITNNNGSDTYTFTENGTFTFEFTDDIGNEGTAVATVDWIDKVAPIGRVTYNIIETTHQEIIATLTVDKSNVTITNNNGSNKYTFTENGEFTFEFVDEAGNTGSATATVTWIDKSLPKATITYSTTEPTNEDVIATIEFDRTDVVVEGEKTHIFTENGSYEFQYTAPTGSGVAIATVNWIDRSVPEATVIYSTIAPTNEDVIATVIFEKEKDGEVTITNNDGNTSYTFTTNGRFTFEFTDRAGNTGTAEAAVTNIDRIPPTATVSYSTTEKTNKNVVATLENISEEIIITNNDGNSSYTFTNNGNFTFEFVDRAGNTGTAEARVEWIDKILPTPTIEYSTTELTNEDVIATIEFNKENVRVDNGSQYTFTKNGEYTFEYTDEAGNNGMATASVDWIDKEAPTASVEYDIEEETTGSVVATLVNESEEIIITNNDGNKSYTFTENGTFTFEFVDKAGNTATATATVDWIVSETQDEEPSFNIALTASKESLNPGDEFEIDISIVNLKNIENGLIAILGAFEYDENVLEITDIIGENDWNMDANSYNKANFKFITENGKYISESGTVIKLKLKVNETIEETQETVFKVVSVAASNGKQDISTADKQIKLSITVETDEPAKITSEKYNVEEEVITRILPGTTFGDFKANISTNRNVTILNKNGEAIGDEDIIATNMTIKVGEELEYSLVVIGDIDQDGKITINDLAILKRYLISADGYDLTGNTIIAADVDNDGTTGINDVARIKMIIVGLFELE